MPRRSATRLRFGPYTPLRYQRGDALYCEVRGETTVVGLTAGRIPWPIGKFGRRRAIIVCGDLVRALKREAACAVIRSWGVGKTAVNKWRRALGVPKLTEGDRLVRAEAGRSPSGKKALRAMWAKANDPERCRKIAEAHRGRPKPPDVVAALRRANLGKRYSAVTRKNMSEMMKRLGRRPPVGELWKPSQDRLVRTLPPAEAARRTGRTLRAVYHRRCELGIAKPNVRTRKAGKTRRRRAS